MTHSGGEPALRPRAVSNRAARRWAILLAKVVLCLAIAYPSGFFLLRKNVGVTTFEGIPLYYFARNPVLNDWFWTLYWPLHQSGRQPVTDNEWIIEQRNCDAIYIRDVRPYEPWWNLP